MDSELKAGVWRQYGAAIDMLEDAINLCPDDLWTFVMWDDPEDERYGQLWFVVYHTLFWIDLYLHGSYQTFAPPPPFVRGQLPGQPYTKDQILTYLHHCRQKCQATLEALTDETAHRMCTFAWIEAPYLEMQLYAMRHVQEHTGQLNLVLGQHGIPDVDWVTQARPAPA